MLNRHVIRALKKLNAIIIMSFVLFMGFGTSVLYAETATAIDQEEALVLKKIIQPDQQANTNQNTSQEIQIKPRQIKAQQVRSRLKMIWRMVNPFAHCQP